MTDEKQNKGLIAELKRRNVFRVAAVYIIASWLIMQVVDVMFPALKLPDWTVTLIAAIIVIGLPLAIIFAWAFELTPDGIKRDHEVDRSQSITGDTGHRLNRIITGVLVIALAYFAIDKFVLRQTASDPITDGQAASETLPATEEVASGLPDLAATSIAVLPFADMSPDGDNEYFADGLSEELLNVLAKLKVFKVAGRTSSFSFKGKNDDLRVIGEQLGVANILEGSVRRAGNRVRVTAQLINASDGFHLWSETYDHDMDDIFAVQDEIATEVVRALKVTLIGEDTIKSVINSTSNTEAFTAFLRGRQLVEQSSFRSVEQGRDLFIQAIALDPNYAAAHAGVAQAWTFMADQGGATISETKAGAEPAIERALALNPGLSEAHSALGALRYLERDFEAATAAFEKALELNPSAVYTLVAYGRFLVDTGRGNRGIGLLERAMQIDPLALRIGWEVAEYYRSIGAKEKALVVYARIREVDPQNPMGYYGAGYVYRETGQLDKALPWWKKASEIDPDDHELLAVTARIFLSLGETAKAKVLLDRILAMAPDAVNSKFTEAYFHHVNGDIELAARVSRDAIIKNMDDRFYIKTFLLRYMRDEAIWSGSVEKMDEVISLYEQTYPNLLSADAQFEAGPASDSAVDFAWLLINADQAKRGKLLAGNTLEWYAALDPNFWPDYRHLNEAALYAALGQNEQALASLRSAVALGWRLVWQYVLDDSVFDSMRSDPGFKALVDEVERDTARMRANLAAPGANKEVGD